MLTQYLHPLGVDLVVLRGVGGGGDDVIQPNTKG